MVTSNNTCHSVLGAAQSTCKARARCLSVFWVLHAQLTLRIVTLHPSFEVRVPIGKRLRDAKNLPTHERVCGWGKTTDAQRVLTYKASLCLHVT